MSDKQIVVEKNGGGCQKEAADHLQIIKNISNLKKDYGVVAVFSALYGVTSELFEVAETDDIKIGHSLIDSIERTHSERAKATGISEEFLKEPFKFIRYKYNQLHNDGDIGSDKAKAMLGSFGEDLSMTLNKELARINSLDVVCMNAKDTKLITEDKYLGAEVINKEEHVASTRKIIKDVLDEGKIVFINGFQGISYKNHKRITTPQRNEADALAAQYALTLDAKKIIIRKDVPGIYAAHPDLVVNPTIIGLMNHSESGETFDYSNKVIHPHAALPARKGKIPIEVGGLFESTHAPTIISDELASEKTNSLVKAVYSKHPFVINAKQEKMLGSSGFVGKIFSIMKDVPVDFIATSANDITFSADERINEEQLQLLNDLAAIETSKRYCLIGIIGEPLRRDSRIASVVNGVLAGDNIPVYASSKAFNTPVYSVLIDNEFEKKAVNLLYDKLINQIFA